MFKRKIIALALSTALAVTMCFAGAGSVFADSQSDLAAAVSSETTAASQSVKAQFAKPQSGTVTIFRRRRAVSSQLRPIRVTRSIRDRVMIPNIICCIK